MRQCSKIVLGVLIILCLNSIVLYANDNAGLYNAIEIGRKQSKQIQDMKSELEELNRRLCMISAGMNWNINLNGELRERSVLDIPDNWEEIFEDENWDAFRAEDKYIIDLTLSGSRVLASGLSISTSLNVSDEEPFNIKDITDDVDFSATAAYTLYPFVPPEHGREIRILEHQIFALEEETMYHERQIILGWIDEYLNIVNLKEGKILAKEEYNRVLEQLEKVQEQKSIGETGIEQVLDGQIAAKQGETACERAKNAYERAKNQWIRDLGLPDGFNINFSLKDSFLQYLREKVEELQLEKTARNSLVKDTVHSSYRIIINEKEQRLEKDKLEWKQADGKPQVDLIGNYDYSRDDFSLFITLSYSLYDGGLRKMETESILANIDSLRDEQAEMIKDIERDIYNLIQEIDGAKKEVEIEELVVEKANLEKQRAGIQLKEGLIDKYEYFGVLLNVDKAYMDLQKAKDMLFINQLNLVHYTGHLSLCAF